jgi:outer membrane protein OmpU
MRKITKTLFAVLSSFALSVSAFAGDLNVYGSATATYTIGGATQHASKALGISNELNFTGSGELDNGYSWTYSMELDEGSSIANDDTQIKISGDMGTFGICISECGLSTELDYGVGAMGTGSDYINVGTVVWGYDVGSYNNVQYHTAEGMLPFGLSASIGYVPNLSGAKGASAKAEGTNETRLVADDATMYRIKASPADGLSIGGDFFTSSGSVVADTAQKQESGSVYAKYSTGPVTVGVAESRAAPRWTRGTASAAYRYDVTAMGLQFAVNENLSISANREKAEKYLQGATGLGNTSVEQTVDSFQAAYTMGGATLGIVNTSADDANYATGAEEEATVLSLALAF